MKSSAVHILLSAFLIVGMAAFQDAIPAVFGAKAPFLLVAALYLGGASAVIAGFLADALGATPFGCSAICFFVLAVCWRRLREHFAFELVAFLAAACHSAWLIAWGVGLPGRSVVSAAALAVPLAAAFRLLLPRLRRHAGIPEAGKAASDG